MSERAEQSRITDHPFTGDPGAWDRNECEFSWDEVTRFPNCWGPRFLHADQGVDPRAPRAEQSKPWPNPLDEAGRPICVCTLERACVMHADRAEQAQPSGYTPPAVGAPTWPRANPGASIFERGDRLEIEWPNGRGMSWVAPKVIEGWVEQVNELRADRDRLRGLVGDAIDAGATNDGEAIGRIRREAGL